jgi:hypothetical protein
MWRRRRGDRDGEGLPALDRARLGRRRSMPWRAPRRTGRPPA